MMLKFIGTGSAFNTKLGNNSAYIKEGNKLFLIDCGSANFHRMKESGLLDDVEFIYVYITHTHADHAGSLADLIFYMYYMKGEHKARVKVISHKEVMVSSFLRFNGVNRNRYELQEIFGDEIADIDDGVMDIGIVSFLTSHVDNLYSTGIIILNAKTEETAVYTSDTNKVSGNILEIFDEQGLSFLYVDTCSQDYEGNVHLSLKKLTEQISPEYRHKVWCMHIDEDFDVEYAKSLGFNVAEVEI